MENIILSKNTPMVIDVDILKSHLRISHNYENEYLKTIIKMATDIVEKQIAKSIMIKEYQFLDYPMSKDSICKVKLPIRNIITVTKVEQNDKHIDYIFQRNSNEISFVPNVYNLPIAVYYKAGISEDVQQIPEELKFKILCVAKNIYDCFDYEQIAERNYYVEL